MDYIIPAVMILLIARAWIHFAPRIPVQVPSFIRSPALPLMLAGWFIIVVFVIKTGAEIGSGYLVEDHGHHNPTHYPQPGNPWPFWRRITFQLALSTVVGALLIRIGTRSRQVADVDPTGAA